MVRAAADASAHGGNAVSLRGHLEDCRAGTTLIVIDTADLQLADLIPPIQQHPSQGSARRVADVHPVHRPGAGRGAG